MANDGERTHRRMNLGSKEFIPPRPIANPRGKLLIAACRSGTELATKIADRYQELSIAAGGEEDVLRLMNLDRTFPDGETCARLERHVGGRDAFLVCSPLDLRSPRTVDQNVMALLISARTLKEAGVSHLTLIVTYLPYSRQDKASKWAREPNTAALFAELAMTAGLDRLVCWHPHSFTLRGLYGKLPVHMLEGLTFALEELRELEGREGTILLGPDAGSVKTSTHLANILGLPVGLASKSRVGPDEVIVNQFVGDFNGKHRAVIVDDILSSCGTVHAVAKKLVEEFSIREIRIVASHLVCLPDGRRRLLDLQKNYFLKKVVVTNTIPVTKEFEELPFLKIRCLSDPLARVVNRIHQHESLSEVFYRP
ncbi:ribose-phosphate diphosphokinase [Elusimicrobiota bacterium]